MSRSSPSNCKQEDEQKDDELGETPCSSRQPSDLPPPHHEGVARARRPSSSFSSAAKYDSPISDSQVPQKTSPSDCKQLSSLVLDESVSKNSKGRKRVSIEKEDSRSKKKIRVHLKPLKVLEHEVGGNLTLTRKSRRIAGQDMSTVPSNACSVIPAVTPTPTKLDLGKLPFKSNSKQNKESPSSSSSSSNKSGKSHLSTTHHPIPEGVTQLYPPRRSTPYLNCNCLQNDHCSTDSFTLNYVLSYGHDNSQLLRRSERLSHATPTPSSQRRASESSSSHLSQGSDEGHSNLSEATPAGGVAWVFPERRSASDNETTATVGSDYMPRQPDLTPKMRAILIDWLIELSEEYNLSPPSLHLAISLVDKSLATGPLQDETSSDGSPGVGLVITRNMLQCLGCACLWIACKIEEIEPPSVDDFVYISDNSYTRQQITAMEMSVCAALRFRIWQVTPYHFMYEFLRASHACPNPGCLPTSHHPTFQNMVLYLIEIARIPYELASRPPSLITAAAVYLARATLGMRDLAQASDTTGIWTKTLRHYTGYDVEQLKETVRLIHQQHRVAGEGSMKQVHVKFLKAKYCHVGQKVALNGEDLGF